MRTVLCTGHDAVYVSTKKKKKNTSGFLVSVSTVFEQEKNYKCKGRKNIALQAMLFDFPNDVFEAHRVQRAISRDDDKTYSRSCDLLDFN